MRTPEKTSGPPPILPVATARRPPGRLPTITHQVDSGRRAGFEIARGGDDESIAMKAVDCDILVIGGGGAGVTAAALAARAGARVVLVSKEPAGRGDTCIASGLMTDGMVNPSDSSDKLIRDLVLCGERLNDPVLVRLLAERSGEATEVLEDFGMVFRRNRKGRLTPIPTPLGGHSVARSVASLAEGNQIGSALRAALYRAGVPVCEEHLVTDLLTDGGQVSGALGVDLASGEFTAWSAKRVILASGGCGWMFAPFTSNMRSNTTDSSWPSKRERSSGTWSTRSTSSGSRAPRA
jgi:succinate dehydrogenase/fumarate reductase flavoprotein subunit